MCPELPSEDVQNFLPHPPTFGEGREGEVVGIHFAKTCVHKNKEENIYSLKS